MESTGKEKEGKTKRDTEEGSGERHQCPYYDFCESKIIRYSLPLAYGHKRVEKTWELSNSGLYPDPG